jgi:hypothetical protein
MCFIPGEFPRFDSSPIVVNVSIGLKPIGDWVSGSGEVPQEELAPMLELDEAEGELVDIGPVMPKLESALPLDAFATFWLVRGAEKRLAAKLDKSSLGVFWL